MLKLLLNPKNLKAVGFVVTLVGAGCSLLGNEIKQTMLKNTIKQEVTQDIINHLKSGM